MPLHIPLCKCCPHCNGCSIVCECIDIEYQSDSSTDSSDDE